MVSPESRHITIAPSLLAADFGRLKDEVAAIEAAGADWLHLDIMDGHFVPNISFGPTVLAALRKHTKLPFDVHLMISPVDAYLDAFIDAWPDVPTRFLLCRDDRMFPASFQRRMVRERLGIVPDEMAGGRHHKRGRDELRVGHTAIGATWTMGRPPGDRQVLNTGGGGSDRNCTEINSLSEV